MAPDLDQNRRRRYRPARATPTPRWSGRLSGASSPRPPQRSALSLGDRLDQRRGRRDPRERPNEREAGGAQVELQVVSFFPFVACEEKPPELPIEQ